MQHLWSVTIQRPSSGIVALEVVDSLRPAGVLLVEVPHGVVVEEEEVGELPRTKCLLWFYHYLHLTVTY